MQFFHVSITLVAQELVVTAQIDFTTFEQYGQFISVFLIKKDTFLQEFQNLLERLAKNAEKWNFRFSPQST